MKQRTTGLSVGIFVLVASALFVAGYMWLAHFNVSAYSVSVRFADMQGLVRQSPVRMRGVSIGEVKDVRLDGLQPVAELAIRRAIRIPVGSHFRVVTGILITSPYVEIEPGPPDTYLASGATVDGDRPTGALTAVSPELAQTVTKLNATFDKLNRRFDKSYQRLDNILATSQVLVHHLDQTVVSAHGVIANPRLQSALVNTVANMQDASLQARATARALRTSLTDIAQNAKGSVSNLTSHLADVLGRIDNTIDDANTVVKRLTDQVTDPRLQQSLQQTTELARVTLARFDQIAADIHSLVGDPELQSNLKASVANLRAASEHGAQAVQKVNSLLNVVSSGAGATRKLHLPETSLYLTAGEALDPTRLDVDAKARFDLGKSIVDLGLNDIGQSTRLTVQAGQHVTPSLVARYGIYSSRLGAGLEWEPTPGTGLWADLYDTVLPRVDAKGFLRVNSSASVFIGVNSLGRRPVPVLGFQLRH